MKTLNLKVLCVAWLVWPFAVQGQPPFPVELLTEEAKLTAAYFQDLDGLNYPPEYFGVAVAANGETLVVGSPNSDSGDSRGAAYVFALEGTNWVQQAKLLPSDGAIADFFGMSVALKDTTIVVGAMGADNFKGAAYVFVREGADWIEQAKLVADERGTPDFFGCSVALDGTNAIVGAYGKDGSRGAVYVFARNGSAWLQPAKLQAADGVANDYFGYSVALNGTNLVVGAYRKDSWKGAAYTFVHQGSTWSQNAKLQAADGVADDRFGTAVAVSGTNLVVGAYGKDSFKGAAYGFVRQGTTWVQSQKLQAAGGAGLDYFGCSVAVSGETLVVGAYGKDGRKGAIYPFLHQGGGWVEQPALTAGNALPEDSFGQAVALDGAALVVGAAGTANDQGAVYRFTRSGADWQGETRLTPADAGIIHPNSDGFGQSLAADGDTIVVGDTNGPGSAHLFVRLGPTAWDRTATLMASDGAPGGDFGHAVAVSGDTAVVSAPGVDHRRGAAYVYIRSGMDWPQQARLAAGDGTDFDAFGQSVAASGDTLAVGACYRDSGRGVVYIFVHVGTNWIQQARVEAGDGVASDYFGWAVGLDGDTLLVGAKGKGEGRGAAYVFVRSGTIWQQQNLLLAPDGAPGDAFGHAVALKGSYLAVGASRKGSASGAAYVFTHSGVNWDYQATLTPSDGAAGDSFAYTLAINENSAMVGAPRKDGYGAAYAFVRSGTNWTQQARLYPSLQRNGGQYGCAAGLSGDTAFLGAAVAEERRGAVYAFARAGTAWTRVDTLALAEKADEHDLFSVSLALDGETLVAGAPGNSDDRGAAYVFVRAGSNWIQQARLRASDGRLDDYFGCAVALEGNTIAVGASRKDSSTGAVYVYTRNGTSWVQQQPPLRASDPAMGDYFGTAVALSGTNLVVGAPYKDSQKGACYVFVRRGETWVQEKKLTSLDPVTRDYFGNSVAVSGTNVAVGANRKDSNRGAVYVFARVGADWQQRAKLQVADGVANDYFGYSLALSGQTLVAGAPPKNSNQGAAYVFRGAGGGWSQEAKLTVSDPSQIQLGYSVAATTNAVLVGAPLTETNQGAVYIFVRSSTGSWVQGARLTTRDRAAGTGLGLTLAASGETIAAGGIYGELRAAYVFTSSYGNPISVTNYVRKFLYVPDAASSPWFSPYQAAFRYKHLLYGADTNGLLRAQFEKMSSFYYGNPERQRAKEAEDFLKRGLACNPASDELGHLLLDLYYDRAVAETFFARDAVTNLTYLRFLRPIPPGGFLIDDEITACQTVLDLNRRALTNYVTLFNDDCGVPGQTPLGCQVFQRLVPLRGLGPATYTNASGQSVPVTGSTNLLFTGYKDLVLLYDLLQDYGQTAVELARLRIMNGDGEATAALQALFADTHRFLTLHGTLWRGLFPNLALPPDDPSGLAQAMAGVNDTLEDLETVQQRLRGRLNPLGFAPDFLMFVQNTDTFDSFDVLKGMLDPLLPGSGALVDARDKLLAARTAYADYRGYQDDLAAQFADSSISYMDRLRDIVGVFPDDPRYTDDPTAFSGSELNQQYLSIQQAHVRILRNNTEISNLKAQMEIELAKAVAVTNVMVDFGNRRADLTEIIGYISAAQAGANALAQMFSPEKLLGPGLFFGAVNVVAQVGGEIGKSQLEADKERLAALEQATIVGLEAAATIKKLLLDMNTLLVDSQEAALALQQEANRLQGLYREKQDLERKLAQRDARLAQRYFADPIHQLRVQSGIVRTDHAFARAQRWLFFMARALEYKWNEPFADTAYDGKPRTTDTLFKLRNAEELVDFFNAMCEWDDDIQIPKDDRYDWFSVREDFFGYRAVDADGQPLLYPDPQTGQWLNATNAFRTNLVRRLQPVLGGQEVVIEFSTVREIPGGSFFVGPTFNTNGTVLYKGRYLDKINWLKIRLLGNHTGLPRPQLMGRLTYGGTSFIRKPQVGQFDLARPDRMRDELTAYSTRYWYNLGQGWRFINALEIDDVFMELSNDPDVPPGTAEINEFKERSVAATGWVLAIPVIDEGTRVLNLDRLDDIKIYFYHYSAQRLEQ